MSLRDTFDQHWVVDENGCHIWQRGANSYGYGIIRNGEKKVGAHRFAWERANGSIPEGMVICHSCDVPACVNVEHLFLGTQRDNLRDAAAKGRTARGEHHGGARWTEDQIREMHRLRAKGISYREIGDRFDTSGENIRVKVVQTWAHVREEFK